MKMKEKHLARTDRGQNQNTSGDGEKDRVALRVAACEALRSASAKSGRLCMLLPSMFRRRLPYCCRRGGDGGKWTAWPGPGGRALSPRSSRLQIPCCWLQDDHYVDPQDDEGWQVATPAQNWRHWLNSRNHLPCPILGMIPLTCPVLVLISSGYCLWTAE